MNEGQEVELPVDEVVAELLNQIANLSIEAAQSRVLIRKQALELSELRKRIPNEEMKDGK